VFEAILLGAAQDAGLPQAGCYCVNCVAARADPNQRSFVTCLGLVDHATQRVWLIDATPDLREQLHLLNEVAPSYALSGILLTHAHIGHYLGLAQLGREVMNTPDLPVYCTPSVCDFLQSNGPWSQLVSAHNINLTPIQPDQRLELSSAVSVMPVSVPHRAEYSDTVAYVARGARRSIFYCPDIDRWEEWPVGLAQFVETVSVALLDGTFFSRDELPGRNLVEIPHPLVTDTAHRLADTTTEIIFVHLNHSNPLWRAGQEREWLTERGLKLGRAGMRWELG
jgi:pyrroloquinoline quinone biosynthesis protein B